MITIIICTVLICVTYLIANYVRTDAYRTAQREYLRQEKQLHSQIHNEPSPYELRRVMHSGTKRWGYARWDNRIGDYHRSNDYYEIYYDVNDALKLLNEVEALGGFSITTV